MNGSTSTDFALERGAVNAALESAASRYLDPLPARVATAIRYALLAEGKRLRPVLFLEPARREELQADAPRDRQRALHPDGSSGYS